MLRLLLLLLPQLQAGASRRPLQVHAGYNCNLPDRKNATSWLDFGWDHLDVLNFGGRTVAVQRDGAATWCGEAECNPPKNAGEAALIAHAHVQGVQVLLKIGWNNSLGGDALHDDEDGRSVTILTDDERPLVQYGDKTQRTKRGK